MMMMMISMKIMSDRSLVLKGLLNTVPFGFATINPQWVRRDTLSDKEISETPKASFFHLVQNFITLKLSGKYLVSNVSSCPIIGIQTILKDFMRHKMPWLL